MSSEIYGIVQAKITTEDIQSFKVQAKIMKDATRNKIETISHGFFINEEKRSFYRRKIRK